MKNTVVKNNAGNTLIETIAAVAILSIALLPMLQTIAQAPLVLKTLAQKEHAQKLVREKMEALTADASSLQAGTVTETMGPLQRETEALVISTVAGKQLFKVFVRVKGADGKVQSETVTLAIVGGS